MVMILIRSKTPFVYVTPAPHDVSPILNCRSDDTLQCSVPATSAESLASRTSWDGG